jgi:hypothetical protein
MQVIKGGKEAFACFSFFADNILKSNPRIYTITVHYHSGAITRIGSRHTIWNPPLSVSRFLFQFMNLWRPPNSSSRSVPSREFAMRAKRLSIAKITICIENSYKLRTIIDYNERSQIPGWSAKWYVFPSICYVVKATVVDFIKDAIQKYQQKTISYSQSLVTTHLRATVQRIAL